ncbi:hypothetical protein DPMN_181591 [Dreissena polymorpha]|uniref:Uncharacterized protein n=1 Tax=Dreissena polymorpha TaxID=45954 RepID=A0A9D4DET4_DREPO|nr:hypothetical protein DPMN_181591 [Dreissena polymorpha]
MLLLELRDGVLYSCPYQFTLEYRPGTDDINPADLAGIHFSKPNHDNAAEAHIVVIVQKEVPKAMSLEQFQTAT